MNNTIKNVRIYYRVANINDISDEFTRHIDLEILSDIYDKITTPYFHHNIEYFYSIPEVKTICNLLENTESLRGYTFLTHSITAISSLD